MSPSVPKPKLSPKKARKPVKRKRTTPRRQVGKCPELLAWIHTQRCWITGKLDNEYIGWGVWEIIDAAHLPRSRRLGGDLFNVIPLTHGAHMRHHAIGLDSWLAEVGKTREELTQAARDYTEKFFRETGVPRPPQENG